MTNDEFYAYQERAVVERKKSRKARADLSRMWKEEKLPGAIRRRTQVITPDHGPGTIIRIDALPHDGKYLYGVRIHSNLWIRWYEEEDLRVLKKGFFT